MSRASILFLVILIISPVIIYVLWPSDESRLKKLFREGAAAVEQEKIDEVLAKVSLSYMDERGLSYLLIKEGMAKLFQNMDNLKIEYEITSIEVKEKTAIAELELRVLASSGSDRGYIAGDISKPFHMKFTLEKERTAWLVTRTEGLPLNY